MRKEQRGRRPSIRVPGCRVAWKGAASTSLLPCTIKAFAAYLSVVHPHDVAELRLGRRSAGSSSVLT
jgi:hypothetical protein